MQDNNTKEQKTILYNFIMNVILTMSSFIFPLITFPYISRILLPAGTGKVAFATSVVNYFLLIAQLGIPTYGIRACARVRDDKEKLSKTVREILLISFIMCIIAYFLFFCALLLIPRFQEEKKLLLITSATILFTTLGVEWLFKALEMYSYITWRSIFFKCIAIAAMFFCVKEQKDYVVYGAISIFASSASGILNFIYLPKLVDLNKRGGLEIKKHIKPILIFFAMSCATTVYLNLDTTMLGFMKTDVDVGYYNAAVKIKNMLVSIVTSLGAVLLPRVTAYLANGETEKFRKLSQRAISFVMFIAIPMLTYFIVFAKQGVFLLSGEEFEKSIIPMKVMMPTLLFIGLTNIMGIQILVPLGKESKVLASTTIGAIIDLGINFVLIPRYSVVGAAIGTVTAELTVFLYQYFSDKDLFKELFKNVTLWKYIVSSIIAIWVSAWVLKLGLGDFMTLLVSSLCSGIVYLISLWLLKDTFFLEVFDRVL